MLLIRDFLERRKLRVALVQCNEWVPYSCGSPPIKRIQSFDTGIRAGFLRPTANRRAEYDAREPRDKGGSLFVDGDWRPYADQWEFLASVRSLSPQDTEPAILRAGGGIQLLDVTFIDEEDQAQPWK